MCIFVYVILYIRYYLFRFPKDSTIYVEDQKVNEIRNDNKLTIYEDVPSGFEGDTELTDSKLHRCFYSRILFCNAPSNVEVNLVVFTPSQTKYLFPNTHLLRLKQSSPVRINEPDKIHLEVFKKSEHIEIPFIGGTAIMIPRGWWVYSESHNHITQKKLFT